MLLAVTLVSAGAPVFASPVLYVHFSDGSLSLARGALDDAPSNTSSLGAVRVPPLTWAGRVPDASERIVMQDGVMRELHRIFRPYDLRLTTRRPAAGPYTMAVVGGSGDLFGFDPTVAGAAKLDCDDEVASNVVFAFPETARGQTRDLAVTIAQEVAHAFGLEHTDHQEDIMYPRLSPLQERFTERESRIVPPVLCGVPSQRSHAKLLEAIGAFPGPGEKPLPDGSTPPPPEVGCSYGHAPAQASWPFALGLALLSLVRRACRIRRGDRARPP